MPYYAMLATRRESCETLDEQLMSCTCSEDVEYMQSVYNPLGNVMSLPPYKFSIMNKISKGVSKKSEAMYYSKMPRNLFLLRESIRLYLGVVAVVMFSGMDEFMGKKSENISSWYLNNLRRKIAKLETDDARFTQDALNEFLVDLKPWTAMMIKVELQNKEIEKEQAGIQ